MKKAVITIDNLSELDSKMKKELENIAENHGASVAGVVVFPKGTVMEHPEIIVDVVKNKVHADMIIATSPEFVINELVGNKEFSKLAGQENIEVIQADFDLELKELMKQMPSEMKKELRDLVDLSKQFKDLVKEQSDNVLFITKSEDSPKVKMFIDELSEQGISKFNQVVISQYDECLNEPIKTIIENEHIDRIYVCDNYDSKFDQLMDELEEDGLEIVADNEVKMSMYHMSMLS